MCFAPVTRGSEQSPLPTGRQIVSRHVTALGGAPAFKAITSIRAIGRMEIVGTGLGGTFEALAARPNRILLRATVPAVGVIESGYDGAVGWSLNPLAGPELLSGRQLEETAEDAWFDAALFEADHVKSVETLARAAFDGRAAFKVKVLFVSGRDAVQYFDIQTGLQIGSEAERATPQGVVPTLSILRDYRTFGRVQQPTTLVQRVLGFEQVVTVSSVELDTVPASAFTPPPVIAALMKR